MIGYTTFGTNDFERACQFYDELFGAFGKQRILEMDNFIAWGTSMEEPGFSVTKPYDGNPATVGNGVMIALKMDSTEQVDAFYAKGTEEFIVKLAGALKIVKSSANSISVWSAARLSVV